MVEGLDRNTTGFMGHEKPQRWSSGKSRESWQSPPHLQPCRLFLTTLPTRPGPARPEAGSFSLPTTGLPGMGRLPPCLSRAAMALF